MKKISTLFKKDPNNLGRVINEINPENQWVFDGDGIPTRKLDGTACAIIEGEIYKRYDVKKGSSIPFGAIPCQEADLITGHHPHWLKCDPNKKEDKYFYEGLKSFISVFGIIEDGTYELVGEKVQCNPENIEGHFLYRHGRYILTLKDDTFEYLKEYLSNPENDIEGIVFHHKTDGRMCKLRKSDFGIHR